MGAGQRRTGRFNVYWPRYKVEYANAANLYPPPFHGGAVH